MQNSDWMLIFTSGALGSIFSILIGALQWYIKHKDEKEKRDTDDFFNRWISAEDEIDKLRDQNRQLKDQVAKLKLKEKKDE
ncbi:hypothetical protein [Lactobacillus crispatus]|uniref:hypothetical protein n=1 Tax=Lactobacillus crispatus TaxID=47770 RepID=UPI002806280E|nr:hypothetical protein [uncultured Lactobacillus sp.]